MNHPGEKNYPLSKPFRGSCRQAQSHTSVWTSSSICLLVFNQSPCSVVWVTVHEYFEKEKQSLEQLGVALFFIKFWCFVGSAAWCEVSCDGPDLPDCILREVGWERLLIHGERLLTPVPLNSLASSANQNQFWVLRRSGKKWMPASRVSVRGLFPWHPERFMPIGSKAHDASCQRWCHISEWLSIQTLCQIWILILTLPLASLIRLKNLLKHGLL